MKGFLRQGQKFRFYSKNKEKLLESIELGLYMSSFIYFKHLPNTFLDTLKFNASIPSLSFIVINPDQNVPPS